MAPKHMTLGAFASIKQSLRAVRGWLGVMLLVAGLGALPTAAGSSVASLSSSSGFQALASLLFLIAGMVLTYLGLRQYDGVDRPPFKVALYTGSQPAIRFLLGWVTLLTYGIFAITIGAVRLTRVWWHRAGNEAKKSGLHRAGQVMAIILGIIFCVLAALVNLVLWALASLSSSGYTSGIPILAQLPLLVTIPFVFIIIRFGLSLAVIIDSDRGPIEAITYIRGLIRGQRVLFWRFEGALFGALLLMAAVLYLVILLIGLLLANETMLSFLFLAIMITLTLPLVTVFQARLYRRLQAEAGA